MLDGDLLLLKKSFILQLLIRLYAESGARGIPPLLIRKNFFTANYITIRNT